MVNNYNVAIWREILAYEKANGFYNHRSMLWAKSSKKVKMSSDWYFYALMVDQRANFLAEIVPYDEFSEDACIEDEHGNCFLDFAAIHVKSEEMFVAIEKMLDAAIDENPSLLFKKTSYGSSPLLNAIESKNPLMVEYLLRRFSEYFQSFSSETQPFEKMFCFLLKENNEKVSVYKLAKKADASDEILSILFRYGAFWVEDPEEMKPPFCDPVSFRHTVIVGDGGSSSSSVIATKSLLIEKKSYWEALLEEKMAAKKNALLRYQQYTMLLVSLWDEPPALNHAVSEFEKTMVSKILFLLKAEVLHIETQENANHARGFNPVKRFFDGWIGVDEENKRNQWSIRTLFFGGVLTGYVFLCLLAVEKYRLSRTLHEELKEKYPTCMFDRVNEYEQVYYDPKSCRTLPSDFECDCPSDATWCSDFKTLYQSCYDAYVAHTLSSITLGIPLLIALLIAFCGLMGSENATSIMFSAFKLPAKLISRLVGKYTALNTLDNKARIIDTLKSLIEAISEHVPGYKNVPAVLTQRNILNKPLNDITQAELLTAIDTIEKMLSEYMYLMACLPGEMRIPEEALKTIFSSFPLARLFDEESLVIEANANANRSIAPLLNEADEDAKSNKKRCAIM